MATLAVLRTQVSGELGLTEGAGVDQTRADLWINRGVRDVLRKTYCYTDQVTATPGAVSEYTLAATVLDIIDLAITGQTSSPERIAAHEVRRLQRGNASAYTGTIQHYALSGNNLLLFHPALGAATVLDMLVVPYPTVMSDGAHDSATATYGGIPEDYAYLVELYAQMYLASYDDDQSSAQGQRYREWYDVGIRDARRELNRKGGHRLARAQVGRRRVVPSSPSATG